MIDELLKPDGYAPYWICKNCEMIHYSALDKINCQCGNR